MSSVPTAVRLRCPPGEALDPDLRALGEPQVSERFSDGSIELIAAGVGGQAQLACVAQRLLDIERLVHRVLLGHVADIGLAQGDGIVAEQDVTDRRATDPGECFEQRRLTRSALSDQGDELARGYGD